LVGGSQPVTFVPGQGGTDALSNPLKTPGNILSYSAAPFGAQVNLSSQLVLVGGTQLQPGTAAGGWGANVTNLSGALVSEIVGSPEADTFYTGPTPTTILGNGGNDLFEVTSGSNILTAGAGSASEFLFAGPGGGNIINGGGNSIVNFSLAPAGVNVNLQTGLATGGFGGGPQTLIGIQNVVGSNFPDVLIAGAAGESLTGGEANGTCAPSPSCGDVLEAGPTGGDILISGGSGNDTFCAQVGCNGMLKAAGGNTMTGGTGDDDFFAKNGGADTITGHSGDIAFTDPHDNVSGIPPSSVNP
jgi:Ca2+-binding RTX toxin-like protein